MKTTYLNIGLLLLRISFSGMMLTHGIPKIGRLFSTPVQFADPFGIGSLPTLILALLGEVVAPLLIIIGFKTKLATIPVIATMFSAAFIIHLNDPLEKKELALIYMFAFLVIYFTGAGKYSLDKTLCKSK